MTAYRLLALDMDGTLLTSDKRISDRTLEAIRTAAQQGIAVALSTGRAINELAEYREALRGTVRYASLLNGCHVVDLDEDETIALHPLDVSTALAIAAIGIEEQAMVHVLTASQTAATPADIERMDEVGMGVYQEMFRQICTPAEDIRAFMRTHGGEICKVNLYHLDQEARMRSYERVGELGVQVALAEATSVECTPLGMTKASGLELLCAHVGCTLDECVAVGDSPNDLDALRAAGLAVAMGNAGDEVRAVADVTVADNDHDGIVEVVEHLLR